MLNHVLCVVARVGMYTKIMMVIDYEKQMHLLQLVIIEFSGRHC